MNRKSLGLIAGLILISAFGCGNDPTPINVPPASTQAQADSTPSTKPAAIGDHTTAARISLEEAKKEFDAGTAVFVDTHNQKTYEAERIKGSVNIMTTDVDDKISQLPKDKKIIAYCSCADEHTSGHLVIALKAKGIDNAYALVGGTRAWRNAGYPMEGTLVKFPSNN